MSGTEKKRKLQKVQKVQSTVASVTAAAAIGVGNSSCRRGNDPGMIDKMICIANNKCIMTVGENNGMMDKILAFLAKDDWKHIDYKEGVCLNMSYYWKDWKSAKILLDKGANTGFTVRTYHSSDYHWVGHPVYTSIRDGEGGNPEGLRMILERGKLIDSVALKYAFDIFFGERYGYFSVDAVAKVAVELALKMAEDDIEPCTYKNNPLTTSFHVFTRLIVNDPGLAAILIKGRNDILDLYAKANNAGASTPNDMLWNEDTIVTAFQKKRLDVAKLLLYHGVDIRYHRRATLNGKDGSAVYALAVGNGPAYQHLLTAYQTFHARDFNIDNVDDAHDDWLKTVRELLTTGTDILQWLPLDKPTQWHSRFLLYHPDLVEDLAETNKIDAADKLIPTNIEHDDDDELELKSKYANLMKMISMAPTGFHVLLQLHLGGLDLSRQVGWAEVLEPRLVEYIARVYGSLYPILLPPLITLSFSYF